MSSRLQRSRKTRGLSKASMCSVKRNPLINRLSQAPRRIHHISTPHCAAWRQGQLALNPSSPELPLVAFSTKNEPLRLGGLRQMDNRPLSGISVRGQVSLKKAQQAFLLARVVCILVIGCTEQLATWKPTNIVDQLAATYPLPNSSLQEGRWNCATQLQASKSGLISPLHVCVIPTLPHPAALPVRTSPIQDAWL